LGVSPSALLSGRSRSSSAAFGRVRFGALGTDTVEQDARRFVIGVLGDEPAAECFGED
jgi:hypothetical protein